MTGISIPLRLRASVDRHQANLARLVESLRLAGMDEPTIEQSVSGIVDSYKLELLEAIKAMAADADGRESR